MSNYFASLHHLYKKNGLTFLVKTLKACSTMLQQSVGGQRLSDLNPLGLRIARTNSGLPRVIPRLHRREIRMGSIFYIRLWATLFGLYRVIDLPSKSLRVKLTTITTPSLLTLPTLISWVTFVEGPFKDSLKQGVTTSGTLVDALFLKGGVRQFLKSLKAEPFLITKASPTARGDNVPSTPQSSDNKQTIIWSNRSPDNGH
jgi:hypothetical protein